ncbi:uncharacterized protein LOC111713217 [Eurytemora carolleeae]|uniref:uncharacterized protein LOC111713217 n=1 Tax=Eurytemora carolleeae TaxID=1294199 RepID=UPI000C768B37|nr:uncharacterized protein LOC111713217 [Eurytemora carolleeae]|eukprot:XP_023343809.1 uncharacterized protein LOC111713217 [Eurytemora affinis]
MEKMKPIKQPPTSEKEIDANLSDEKLKKEESVQQEIDQDGSEIEWMMHSSAGYKNKPKLKNKPRNSKTKKTISEPVKPDEMATKEIKGRNAADVGGKKKSSSTSKKKAVEDGEATVVSQEDVCKAATIVLSRRKTKKGVYSGASELNSPFTRKDSKKVVAIKTVESATAPKNSLEAVSIEALDLAAACLELGTEAAAKSESSGKKDVGHGTSGFKPSFTEEKAKKAVATGTVEFGSATAKNTQEAAASIEAVEMKASCVEFVTKAVAIGTKEPESAYAENSKEASSIVPVGIETAAINDQVKPPIDTRARPKEKEVLRKKNTTEPSSTKNQEFRNERMKKNFSALRNRQMFPRCHGCNIFLIDQSSLGSTVVKSRVQSL